MIDDVDGLPTKMMIGIPAYTGMLTVQAHRTVSTIVQCCQALGIEAWDVTFAGCCYLDLARNELVRQFLESEAEALLFLDADVGAEPAAIVKLLQVQKAVVAGVYPKKTTPAAWPVLFDGGQLQVNDKGAIEAAGVPTGFLLVYRPVFVAMQPHVTLYKDDTGQQQHAYFETRMEQGRFWGEDFVFCRTWRQLGGKVWMVPDIHLEHVGVNVWHGSYATWYASRPSWDKIEGFFNVPQLYQQAVIEVPDGGHLVEVGAWKGRSTAFLAEIIKASRKRITFDVVDHFQGSAEHAADPDVQAGQLRAVFEANVSYCRDVIGTVQAMSSLEAAGLYADASLDWVCLDASHDPESVYRDCAAWWPKIKKGGHLAGDDWNWDGVQAGIQAYFSVLSGDYELQQFDAVGWRIRKPQED